VGINGVNASGLRASEIVAPRPVHGCVVIVHARWRRQQIVNEIDIVPQLPSDLIG